MGYRRADTFRLTLRPQVSPRVPGWPRLPVTFPGFSPESPASWGIPHPGTEPQPPLSLFLPLPLSLAALLCPAGLRSPVRGF